MFWTYLLHCNGGRLYTGQTDNLERRIAQHHAGRIPGFTRDFAPIKLIWSETFPTRDEALAAERRIKGWSRAKKLALARGDWETIAMLARKKSSPSTGSGRTEPRESAPPPVRAEPVEALPSCEPDPQ